MVDRIEGPDPKTVVFRLKRPTAAFLALLASPFNYVDKAEILAKDPRWYEKHVMGSGPSRFVEHVAGSQVLGKRNDDYFVKGRPYLDGFRARFVKDTAARVAAIRGGRAHIEFRGFAPAPATTSCGRSATRWSSRRARGSASSTSPSTTRRSCSTTRASDARSRSRSTAGNLSRIAIVKSVGGLIIPGSRYAMPEAELVKIAGFGKDIEASRREARRLLKEAGVPDGFAFTFKNRNIPMPFEPVGIFLIDQWRKIGLNIRQVVQETAIYFNELRSGNDETSIDFQCGSIDEPDLELPKFISSDRSPINTGRYTDRTLDELFEAQSRATDVESRRKLIGQFERRVLDEQAHYLPTLWWHRIVPHSSAVKGWKITPSHYLNQDLRDVWLAE
jgi:peptide/nickel transport system substrate-binding protein